MTRQGTFERFDRLARIARHDVSPPVDVRAAVRGRIRQLETPGRSASAVVFDLRPWLVASGVAAMTAVIVGVMAMTTSTGSGTNGNGDQSLASLTKVVEVSLQ